MLLSFFHFIAGSTEKVLLSKFVIQFNLHQPGGTGTNGSHNLSRSKEREIKDQHHHWSMLATQIITKLQPEANWKTKKSGAFPYSIKQQNQSYKKKRKSSWTLWHYLEFEEQASGLSGYSRLWLQWLWRYLWSLDCSNLCNKQDSQLLEDIWYLPLWCNI